VPCTVITSDSQVAERGILSTLNQTFSDIVYYYIIFSFSPYTNSLSFKICRINPEGNR